ncbi:LIC_13387 family protein [Micromonospora sp. L32]|uniref:LIC_13387 family protein n=1 Tax=Micromonospora TaxID=1873 RepID=UPI003F8A2EBB
MIIKDKVGRRQRTAVRVGGWAFVLTGTGHVTLASLMPSTGDMLAVARQMEQARFPMTPSHSVADLMQGFSVAMSVLLVAWGVSILLMTRHGRAAEQAQVALMLALSLALLATALLLLPAPPIVLMTVASVAFAVALGASRRATTPTSTPSSRGASPTTAGR